MNKKNPNNRKRTLGVGAAVALTALIANGRIKHDEADTNQKSHKNGRAPVEQTVQTTSATLGETGINAVKTALDSAFFYLSSDNSGSRFFTTINRTEKFDITPPPKSPPTPEAYSSTEKKGNPQETIPPEDREYEERMICEATFANSPVANGSKTGTEVSISYSHTNTKDYPGIAPDDISIRIRNNGTGQMASLSLRGELDFYGAQNVCNLPPGPEQLQYIAQNLLEQPDTEVYGGANLVGYQYGYNTAVSTSTVRATDDTMPTFTKTIQSLLFNPNSVAPTTVPSTTPQQPTNQRPQATVQEEVPNDN